MKNNCLVCAGTLYGHSWEKDPRISERDAASPGVKAIVRNPGLAPDVHLPDLLLVILSYGPEETHKTSVWSLAFMFPVLSIYSRWLAVPSGGYRARYYMRFLPRAQI